MRSSVFTDAIVFICAHNEDGCMGFIINKPHEISLSGLLRRVDGMERQPSDVIDELISEHQTVRLGGPIDENRGFILHSTDYEVEATIPVTPEIALTSTLSILRDISNGIGPRQAMISLGYAS
ncbi:MAG: YqgE/AlgH family protein, partial [Pseudomonadota bacterium]